jgi:hypothetical protein
MTLTRCAFEVWLGIPTSTPALRLRGVSAYGVHRDPPGPPLLRGGVEEAARGLVGVAVHHCAAGLAFLSSPASMLELQLCARAPNLRFLGAKRANPGCFYQEAQIPDLRFLGDFSRNGWASWQKYGKYHRFCPPVFGRSGKPFALLGKFRAFLANMVALLGKSSALFVVFLACSPSKHSGEKAKPGGRRAAEIRTSERQKFLHCRSAALPFCYSLP